MANEQNNFENDVSGLLGSMKRADAPGNFDFRVRARIAAGRPAVRAVWVPAAVQAAVPLGLLVLVGGYFGFNALYSSNNPSVPPVAEAHSPITSPANNVSPGGDVGLTANDTIAGQVEPKLSDTGSDAGPTTADRKIPTPENPADQPDGGSRDEALRIGQPRYPRGINPGYRPASGPNDPESGPRVSTRDALSIIGVEANNSGSAWMVREVKQNSVAERSGLKAGDIIEAVNGKKVRVRRDGKIVQIDLKP